MPTIFESPADAAPRKSTGHSTVAKPLDFRKADASTMGPLTSFAVNPRGVRFETQEEEETVILFLRQHFIVNVPWLIMAFFLALAPTIVLPLFVRVVGITVTIPYNYIIVATVGWYLATFGFVLSKFLGWFINIYIVTDERVVDIDFYYLLYKHFTEAELNRIQDISYSSGGIFAAMFNFGDVTIETAGEAPNLVFEKIPHPEQVVETIRELTEDRQKTTI